ncbi:MAG: THUMP domain-containing protein, partial [Anaerovorax sp.]
MMEERNTFIVRCGEVALKGLNKPYFERMLVERIKKVLKKFDGVSVKRSEGLIFVTADQSLDKELVIKEITKVFGVASVSPAVEVESEMEAISEGALAYMLELLEKRDIKTFKVDARRADKAFPVQSPEIGRMVGAKILIGCKVLKVDVHHPDCLLFINVRRDKSYIFEQKVSGFGGLPLGTNGKGMLLLSGGIDSPVAGWMMSKRGMLLEAMHFHSYPYTSQRALEKVEDLGKIMAVYCGQ